MPSPRSPELAANDPPMRSTSSSPGPSEMGDVDDRQRSQDAHLAQSMAKPISLVPNRARSNTVQKERDIGDGASGAAPSARERSGTMAGSAGERDRDRDRALGTSPPRAGPGAEAMANTSSRRRPSVSAVNPLEHLADEMAISDHQQAQLDRAGAGGSPDYRPSPSHQRGFTPHSLSNAFVQPGSAARRFYRQQRNLSESSIDSQGGAFIDHRRQPHSLSIGQQRAMANMSAGGIGRMMAGGGSPADYRSSVDRRHGSSDEHRSHGGRQQQQQDFIPYRDESPPSPSHPRHSEPDPYQSAFSSRTARQGSHELTTADLDENAVLTDDDLAPSSPNPRSHLERHESQKSYKSYRSHRSTNDGGRALSNHASRRGSFQPEEDVCFPAHGAAADVDLLDLGMGAMYMGGVDGHHPAHHHDGVPGVLHNYPFPFDFGALEEFADREREGMAVRPRNMRTGTGGAAVSASPPGAGEALSVSPDGLGKRMFRQRKLSTSVAPGRFQRNLAPFEGAGEDVPPPSTNRGFGTFASILDTKTPLLGGDKAARPGYGSNVRQSSGVTGTGAARPYRFSFYSNALPSTIHARSLAEIPGEGQTFEDLFTGLKSSSEDEEPYPDLMSSPPSRTGTTGTSTPKEANVPLQASGGNARPSSGVPASALGAKGDKPPKSAMMRTDLDAEANTWWLDVMCPTDAEMKVLSKVFGIHPLTTEDIQMEETREKTELFRNYYFVCFRSFEQDPYSPTYLEPLNMYIIVFREGTLSFHFRGTPHPQNVRRRIKQLKDYINVTSDWISYALIDDITDAFGPLIQNIEYEVDSIDELVLILKETEQSDMLRRIGMCRKKVMGLLRLMGNKVDVVKGLAKRCNENWSVAPKSDIGLYLSDIQDHITTSTQNLTHYEKILSRSHSNYLAQISIEMTDANNQINDVLSKLTALGTVLIPMNLITGLWGMNVNVPGQGIENLHWFFSIIGCLGAIALGGAWLTYRVFVR